MSDKLWLNGKTVVLTGASSGMGKDIAAKLLYEKKCNVIGIGRNEKRMQDFAQDLGEYSKNFSYQLFDVSKRENWTSFAEYLTENNIQIDVLINNAGILPRFDRFDKYSIEEIEEAMAINFFSAVYSVHTLIPQLLKGNNPAIVNIDSSAALMALAGTSIYSASKAALKSFSEALREEFRGKCYVGIVCPGFTKTDIFRNQSAGGGDKAFDMISTPCNTMVDKIVNGISRKNSLMVYGKDAVLMNIFNTLMPVNGTRLFSAVMKMSKLPLFDSIFND